MRTRRNPGRETAVACVSSVALARGLQSPACSIHFAPMVRVLAGVAQMLRWLTGGFTAAAATGVAGMILERGIAWPIAAAGVAASSVAVFRPTRRVAALAGYFSIIQAASLVGVLKGTFGRVEGTWSTARETSEAATQQTPSKGFLQSSLRRLRRSAAPVGKTGLSRRGLLGASTGAAEPQHRHPAVSRRLRS